MYILVKDNQVAKYPYSLGELKADNSQTSFPQDMSAMNLAEWGVYPVIAIEKPQVDYTKNVIEETPNYINGQWYQDYHIVDATSEEIAQRIANLNKKAEANRAQAYQDEADPLFFKWQRGEATEQEWLDKVAEIKARYPEL